MAYRFVATSSQSLSAAYATSVPPVGATLQEVIDNGTAGSTIDLTGQTYAASSTVLLDKRLKLLNGTLNSSVVDGFTPAIDIRVNGLDASNHVRLDGMAINGGGHAVRIEGLNVPVLVRQFITLKDLVLNGQTGAPIAIWNNAHDITVDGVTIVITGGNGTSSFIVRDESNSGNLRDMKFLNLNVDSGTRLDGHFGLEAKFAYNCEVSLSYFRGGKALVSLPDCVGWHIHDNEFDQTRPAGGGLDSGPQWGIENANGSDHIEEDNWFHGSGSQDDGISLATFAMFAGIENNSGADGNIMRRNRFENMYCAANVGTQNLQFINNCVWLESEGGTVERLTNFGPGTGNTISGNSQFGCEV